MGTSDLFARTPEAAFRQRAVKPISQRPLKYIILSGTEIDETMSGALIRNLVTLQLRSKRSKDVMRAVLEVPVNDDGLNIKTLEN